MKVLVAGDWHSTVHEEPAATALEQLGCEVVRFPWHGYFDSTTSAEARRPGRFSGLSARVQNRFMFGPRMRKLNDDLAYTARRERPDFILLYRPTHVTADCLRSIRALTPNTMIVSYNNDDPFAPGYPAWLWRHFRRGVSLCDLVLSYRPHNVADYARLGARRVRLLRSWFVPEVHRPLPLTDTERASFGCDVVFAGHYEPDGRLETLEKIVRAGFHLRIFGPGHDWEAALQQSDTLRAFAPVQRVWRDDYVRALCGAKVALCFLSKLNRDSYTRRNFEIPATGTLMLSEFTEDLAGLFNEGMEADFFRSDEELVRKLGTYVSDEARRRVVAEAGKHRVWADGHDVRSRMQSVIDWVAEIRTASHETARAELH